MGRIDRGDEQMTCYLIGGCIRTSWERSGIWLMTFHSHYGVNFGDKVHALVKIMMMADHPAYSLRDAEIRYQRMHLPHEAMV